MSARVLTREEKLRKYDLIQEKKRRILARKPVYKPNEGQLPVHMDQKAIRIVAAGNGGGKTALAAQEVLWWCTGYNPLTEKFSKVPATVVLLLDAPSKVEEVWLTELRKWYPLDDECVLKKDGKPYVCRIEFKNGSQIIIMFHEQAPLVFEGIQLDYLVADEPFPRPIWIALTRGARKKGRKPRFLIIGTPLGQPWMYNDLWKKASNGERDDVGLHRFSTEANRNNLAEGYIEQFSKNLTDHEKKVRLGGHFAHLEGLALAHLFDRRIHVVPPFEWARNKPVVVAIDPHPAKGHYAVMIGATGDGRLYYLKEMNSKSAPGQFAKELKAFYAGYRLYDCVVDSLGETPGTGGDGNKSFSEKLRECGVPARSTSFKDKSDADFIQNIQQVLEVPQEKDSFGRQIPKLAIIEGNTGIIDNIESVQWAKYRQYDVFKEKLDITQKEYLACLKYAMKSSILFIADRGRVPRTKRSRRSPWSGSRS